jgi:hypothetical protein
MTSFDARPASPHECQKRCAESSTGFSPQYLRAQPAFVGMRDLSTSELVERLRLGRRLAGDGWLAQRPCTWLYEGCWRIASQCLRTKGCGLG